MSFVNSFAIKTPRGMRTIGQGHRPFIVAEMSANHGQNYEKAVAIIKAAAAAGADAIKLQTYTAETMTIDSNKEWFRTGGGGNPELWSGETLYSIYQKAYTPWEWHKPLQKIAEDLGLVFFSTPFDTTAVDFLEQLNVPMYKIASYEVTDIPLLKYVAQTKKPVILSTGFATEEEISEAVKTLRENGTKDLVLLHCVTAYSKEPKKEEINLNTMNALGERFRVIYGFSDNNAGVEIPLQAAIMGAAVIEKHIVADENDETFDADFSVNPQELKLLVDTVRSAGTIAGKIKYGTQGPAEEHNKKYRKSIFVVEDMMKGDLFTEKNVKIIRPALGIKPRHYETILGKRATQNIEKGTPLCWEFVK